MVQIAFRGHEESTESGWSGVGIVCWVIVCSSSLTRSDHVSYGQVAFLDFSFNVTRPAYALLGAYFSCQLFLKIHNCGVFLTVSHAMFSADGAQI